MVMKKRPDFNPIKMIALWNYKPHLFLEILSDKKGQTPQYVRKLYRYTCASLLFQ